MAQRQLNNFKSIQSKNKDTLVNLSQLLGNQTIQVPQKIIEQKFSSLHKKIHPFQPNLMAKIQSAPTSPTKNNMKINFQHYRIKSTLKNKNPELLVKSSCNQNLRSKSQKLIRFASCQSGRLHVQNSKLDQGTEVMKSHNSQQFQSLKLQNKLQLTQKMPQSPIQTPDHFLVTSLQKNKNQMQSSSQRNPSRSFENKKKNFLKKGTSIQKQIVINLLKNKLIKQHQLDVQKEYTVKDILGMIRVYKGLNKQNNKNSDVFLLSGKRNIRLEQEDLDKKYLECPLNIVNEFKKSIEGWEIEPEFQILS